MLNVPEANDQNKTARPNLNGDWQLSVDTCATCGSQLWRREWPDAIYCEKCNRETNTTSALSYL